MAGKPWAKRKVLGRRLQPHRVCQSVFRSQEPLEHQSQHKVIAPPLEFSHTGTSAMPACGCSSGRSRTPYLPFRLGKSRGGSKVWLLQSGASGCLTLSAGARPPRMRAALDISCWVSAKAGHTGSFYCGV